MQKKNTVKSQKGVISVYVGVCIVTFILILTAIYTIAVAVRKSQIKTLIKVKEVYEQDNTKIASIYEEQKRLILEKLEVGTEVKYSPSGTYNWQAKYCSSTKTETTDDVTLSSNSGQSFAITNWKVLSIDRATGKVELVPSAPTTGTVHLGEAQGYNNGVKLLNDACSSLYGNAEKGIEARSINIEDIEKCMTDTALAEVHNTITGSANTVYGKQISSPFTSYKRYPVIYGQEIKSVINGTENSTGLGLSEQTRFIERSEGTSITSDVGSITTATSIQPYQTYWEKKGVYNDATFFKDRYLELLLPQGVNTPVYWVATRYEHLQSVVTFGIRIVATGDIRGYGLITSNTPVTSLSSKMFPVVTLNINTITYDATNGYIVK